MSSELIPLIIVGAWLLAGGAILFLGGWLVRHDLERGAKTHNSAPPLSRTLEDLRPVQDLAVDFFAQAEPCARLLRLLARHTRPLTLSALFHEIRPLAEHRGHGAAPPFGIEWAALWLMRLAGLVRLDRCGVLLTETGREVHQRISAPAREPRESARFMRPSAYDALFLPSPVDTGAGPHRDRVRQAQQNDVDDDARRTHPPAAIRLGELRQPRPLRATDTSIKSSNQETLQATPMKTRPITMTATDHEQLTRALAATRKLSERGRTEVSALQAELGRAEIVPAAEVPPDVITLNSRAELMDLESGERMDFTLVFPAAANIEAGRISVLAPLGTAMLGQRAGDEFAWKVPYGVRRLKVNAVHFQPEAALATAA